MRISRFVILLTLHFVLIHCTSKTKSTLPVDDRGVWQGKTQIIKNERDKKWAYVTWVSDSDQKRMRIDVTAILDVPIATYIRDESGASLWLYTESKTFHSSSAQKLFSYLTKVDFNPDHFFHILGRPQALGRGWDCDQESTEFHCQSVTQNIKLTVKYEQSNYRQVNIIQGLKTLKLRLNKTNVELRDSQFKRPKTPQFETYQI